jgi:Peptidase propeptide and YPEB domain
MTSAATGAPARGRPPVRVTWPRVLVIALVLAAAFVVAKGCQQSQVRVTKEQAIAAAKREVDFSPRITNVRLLRQGLGSKPFWFVNLSVPGRDINQPRRLSVVKIDANTGKIEDVDRQR